LKELDREPKVGVDPEDNDMERFSEVKDTGNVWKIMKSLGLGTEKVAPVCVKDLMKALDNEKDNERVVYVWGSQDEVAFFEKLRKLKRSRRAWTFNVEREGSGIDIDEIPLMHPIRHEIYALFDEGGVQITPMQEIGQDAERQVDILDITPELNEEKIAELFKDKTGDPIRLSSDFWERQGKPPTLPTTKIGVWIEDLRESPRRPLCEVSPMVLKGLAKSTMEGHLRCRDVML
jgi:hypothetical protein